LVIRSSLLSFLVDLILQSLITGSSVLDFLVDLILQSLVIRSSVLSFLVDLILEILEGFALAGRCFTIQGEQERDPKTDRHEH